MMRAATGNIEPMTDDTPQLLADRYGVREPGNSTLLKRVAMSIVLIAAMLVTAWFALGNHDGLSWKDVGYNIAGPSSATATFEIVTPPDQEATCRLTALNEGYAQVGVLDTSIPATDGVITRRVTVEMATVELATTVVVETCWLD